jgi:hypothetical protein
MITEGDVSMASMRYLSCKSSSKKKTLARGFSYCSATRLPCTLRGTNIAVDN